MEEKLIPGVGIIAKEKMYCVLESQEVFVQVKFKQGFEG